MGLARIEHVFFNVDLDLELQRTSICLVRDLHVQCTIVSLCETMSAQYKIRILFREICQFAGEDQERNEKRYRRNTQPATDHLHSVL